ncbi:MAG: EAL domain-containing protein [Acidimicrobiia bacterium]|nr:EAL domain-containing protein [Acidimicrobiia bacterium]
MTLDGFRRARPDTRWLGRGLDALAHIPAPLASLALAGTLLVCWVIGYQVGGAGVAPHWFYVPIILAAVRFGYPGAFGTALTSTLVAGPLLPADVETGAAQPLSDWLVRGGFFVGLGLFIAFTVRWSSGALASELDRLRREQALRHGLERGEFELLYQPIVRLADEAVAGVEALIRWSHPDLGTIGPDRFIPFAEETGAVVPLGRWVLENAVRQAAAWQRLSPPEPLHVTVNLSGRHLVHADVVAHVESALAGSGLDPGLLVIEITETAVVDDLDTAIRRLHTLRALGVKLAIDDFGTGHSSLASIRDLPVGIVKIDRKFTAHALENHDLIAGVLALSASVGLTVVAEGIETRRQAELLHELGCRYGQGYLYGWPQPPEAITERLVSRRRSPAQAALM